MKKTILFAALLFCLAAFIGCVENIAEVNEYTVSFDSQGGTVCSQIVEKEGSTINLPTPTKSGWTFNGWYSAASGGTYYGVGGDVYTVVSTVTIYAQWTENIVPPIYYTITFDTQGGSEVNDSPITQLSGTVVTLPAPTRSGYTFNGWYSSSSGGSKYDSPYTLTNTLTMYAQWTAINYTLTFDSQGGNNVSSITAVYNSNVTLPMPTKAGYTFNGWYSSSSGGSKYDSPYTLTNTLTMYAQWTALPSDTYVITFNSNGGTVSPAYETGTSGASVTLPTPTRLGYIFSGWFSASSAGIKYDSPYTISGNVTMYAQWTAINYTLTFDTQGGISVPSTTQASGTVISLPATTRSGWTFNGWYSAISGGTKYGDGGDNYTVSANITMFAQWTAITPNTNSYTLTFDTQGGSSIPSTTQASGTEVTLPTPERSGWAFNGWYSAATGGTKYDNPYKIAGNVTMYAQWTEIVVTPSYYTITFDTQGGTSVASTTQASGTVITLPTPMRYEYTFDGWYSAASGGTKYDSPYTITGSLTMYAQWTIDDESGLTATINGIECVLVKAGTFMMGSPESESERGSDELRHQVTLTRDYWIGKYEITQAQYRTVMGSNPSNFSGDDRPVERVTWTQANEFAQSLGGGARLPTEAEWEFAARGGNKSESYIYSGSNTVGDVAWYSSNSSSKTQPVGDKQPNELGIYDMSGNVWEWCSDWYAAYPMTAVTDPTGPSSGTSRIIRGGCWYYFAQGCRVAVRGYDYPSYYDINVGFRMVFPRN